MTGQHVKCADTYSKNSDMPNPFPYEGYSSDASPTSVYLSSQVRVQLVKELNIQALSVAIADPSADSATVAFGIYRI